MVVGEDDRVGPGGDGWSEDFPRMDQDLVQQSVRDRFYSDEPAARVEEQDLKTFDRGGNGVVAEDGRDRLGMIEHRGFMAGFFGQPAGQGEGRLQGDGLVPPNASAAQLLPGGSCERLEAAEPLEEIIRDADGGGPLDAGPEDDGDEFRGTEGIGAPLGEAFPGAIRLMEIKNAVVGSHGCWTDR
jgi:hypothetical protein